MGPTMGGGLNLARRPEVKKAHALNQASVSVMEQLHAEREMKGKTKHISRDAHAGVLVSFNTMKAS